MAAAPVVAFESPQRLRRVAALARRASTPTAQVAVCRELTKRFEEVVRGDAAELAARFAEPPKGEITLVVAPGAAAVDVDGALAARGRARRGRRRRGGVAAEVVARLTDVPAKRPLPRHSVTTL